MRLRRLSFRPLLETLEDRLCLDGTTTTLPISAFLNAQGKTAIFTPAVGDQIGWSNSTFDPGATTSDPTRFMMVDYTGQAAKYLLKNGIDLHTQITGTVIDSVLSGSDAGLREVSVNLEATNALTWVINSANLNTNLPGVVNQAPLELGYRAEDLVANHALKPALSSVHMQFTFKLGVGSPMPDIVQALNLGAAPDGFAPESINFQAWGSGTLRDATTAGTAGNIALVNTSQIGDLVHNLPAVLGDGFVQEPVNIIPVSQASSSMAYLNGTLFVVDTTNRNDTIVVTPTGTGVRVTSNLGNASFGPVTSLFVGLGSGNSTVVIASLSGAKVNVEAHDGNNVIIVGNAKQIVVGVGKGNNLIVTGSSEFTWILAGGGNNIILAGAGQNNIYVLGKGNNLVVSGGTGDFVQVQGNGNNIIRDTGTAALVTLAGDGNNDIDNQGVGSFTKVIAGAGRNRIRGPR